MHDYIKIIIPLSVCALGLRVVAHELDWDHLSPSLLEVYYNFFGVLYAIIIGFVLLVVLNSYNALRNSIYGEINAINDVRDFLMYMEGEKAANKVRKAIKGYLESVVHGEWKKLEDHVQIKIGTSKELHSLIASVDKLKPKDEGDEIALEQVIDRVADITTFRTNRLNANNDRLPRIMIWLIVFLSTCVVAPLLFMHYQSLLLGLAVSMLACFATSFILLIVLDLNDPYDGLWHVSKNSFENLLQDFDN